MRRVMAIWFPFWPAERRVVPPERTSDAIRLVLSHRHGVRSVAATCRRGHACGIRFGMPLVEARAVLADTAGKGACDSIDFEADPSGDMRALRRLAARMLEIAPTVAPVEIPRPRGEGGAVHAPVHGLFAELTGCERWLRWRMGLAGPARPYGDPRAAEGRADGLGEGDARSDVAFPHDPPDAMSSGSRATGKDRDEQASDTGEAERRQLEAIRRRLGRRGISARLAIAGTPGAAWALARFGAAAGYPRCVAIGPGCERQAIGPLPIECLRLDPADAAGLREVEVRTVDDLLALDRAEVADRFRPGRRAARAGTPVETESDQPDPLRRLDQALGADRTPEPLRAVTLPRPLAIETVFTGPISDGEVLAIAFAGLVDRLCRRLRRTERGIRLLRLRATPPRGEPWTRLVPFGHPTRRPGHVWSILRPIVESIRGAEGFDAVSLELVRGARVPTHAPARLPAEWSVGPADSCGEGIPAARSVPHASLASGTAGDAFGVDCGEVAATGKARRPNGRTFDRPLRSRQATPTPTDGDALSTAPRESPETECRPVEIPIGLDLRVEECVDLLVARLGIDAVEVAMPAPCHEPEGAWRTVPLRRLGSVSPWTAPAVRTTLVGWPFGERPTWRPPRPEPIVLHADGSFRWRGAVHRLVGVGPVEILADRWWIEARSSRGPPVRIRERLVRWIRRDDGLRLWIERERTPEDRLDAGWAVGGSLAAGDLSPAAGWRMVGARA